MRLSKRVVLRMRRRGRRDLHRIPQLQHSQFSSISNHGAILVDLRKTSSFVRGFIPGSYNLPLEMPAALFRQGMPPGQRTVYLIGDCENPQRLLRDFAEQGLEIAGWFQPDVLGDWQSGGELLGAIEELDPDPLAVRIAAWKTVVVDVRDKDAFRQSHIPEALNLPLRDFRASVAGLPQQSAITVVCENGGWAAFAASLLWNMGYRNVAILRGGFRRYLEAGLKVNRG